MANISVRELIKRYEDLIATGNRKTWAPPKMQDAIRRSFSDVSVHYPEVEESPPGERSRGVLKVIGAVEISPSTIGIKGESEEYVPESQSIEKIQWLHKADSGCFSLVVRRLNHLFRLHRPSNQIMQLDQRFAVK